MTQESNRERKDSFITHHEDSNQNDNESTDEREYVKCMNVHVSCSRRTVASHNALDVKNLIIWSNSAKRINAVSSAQTNITSKDA